MTTERQDRRFDIATAAVWLAIAAIAAVAFCACQTVEVIVETPEAYWTQTWAIIEALLADLLSVLDWIL